MRAADTYAMSAPDPYELLGLSETATRREIELAWTRARNLVDSMADSAQTDLLSRRRVEVDFAREVLLDPSRRKLLDDYRAHLVPVAGVVGGEPNLGVPITRCESCGEGPAKRFHFRQRVAKRRVESVSGVFCRTCALATFRETSNKTLLQGFWRLMGLVSTVAVLRGNIEERTRVMALAEPSQEFLNTKDPGLPLYLRSGMAAVAVTVLLLGVTVSQVMNIGGSDQPIPGIPALSSSVSAL